jgi:hypothetical protein
MAETFKDVVEVAIHSKLDSLSTNSQFAASLRLDNNEFANKTNCVDMPIPVSLEVSDLHDVVLREISTKLFAFNRS